MSYSNICYFSYSLQDAYNVHESAQFNVAENIATTSDMPYNAEKLINRMKLDPRYDNNNMFSSN